MLQRASTSISLASGVLAACVLFVWCRTLVAVAFARRLVGNCFTWRPAVVLLGFLATHRGTGGRIRVSLF